MNAKPENVPAGRSDLPGPVPDLQRLPVPLYLAFVASGVGVALPGAVLPAMLQRWTLSDAQAGRLFLFAWIGSSLGALGVQGSLRKTLLAGFALITAGALLLAFASGIAAQANASMLAYGLGLGLTMTSISLIQKCCSGERSGRELIRLNLLWAVGACLCPSLAEHALAHSDVRPLLTGLAACFALLTVWSCLHTSLSQLRVDTNSFTGWTELSRVPLALVLMTMLVTGIEASAGAWLATYARRSGQSLAGVIAAPTCLWAGLLLSRFLWSLRERGGPGQVVRGSIALITAAAIVLVVRPETFMVAAAALCLGLGIGPVYPLLLDAVLRYTRGGPIFFLAGVGSACLPWLTGTFSSANASLRTGMLVPASASALLLTLALATPLRAWIATRQTGSQTL